MASIWDKEIVLQTIDKGKRGETIVVKDVENKYGRFVDIRQNYKADDGTDRPTTKGICIPIAKVSEIAETLVAFLVAEAEASVK